MRINGTTKRLLLITTLVASFESYLSWCLFEAGKFKGRNEAYGDLKELKIILDELHADKKEEN